MTKPGELQIDLLRHGEAQGGNCLRGRTDDPLTEDGWSQMEQAVGQQQSWNQIISSPARRCADFATSHANQRDIPLGLDSDLWEMDFGNWEGQTISDLIQSEPDTLSRFWQNPMIQIPPGGEPFAEFRQRVLNGWQQLLQKHESGRLLVIAHGGPIRLILAEVLDIPMENLLRLELPHAALSRIRISRDANGTLYPSLVFHNRSRLE
ncbi:MAG: histidine phosphatase family protein [endosymbiont of Seepiophila jonesi]|uniref:Histidine phosphatase family protein n=1 Tax=endosymbiont of Lamellibrachia luymesi TaxID=2200907 RepID=A0A370DZN7_9GAMM|nr:MAG: histidine phosphatase family protein [endosymbiont of Seepiophila jonesi]RDH91213.1 MAG: histidine phosphatase family protein [endosymbiont of Lamellibrachia luymesi]